MIWAVYRGCKPNVEFEKSGRKHNRWHNQVESSGLDAATTGKPQEKALAQANFSSEKGARTGSAASHIPQEEMLAVRRRKVSCLHEGKMPKNLGMGVLAAAAEQKG